MVSTHMVCHVSCSQKSSRKLGCVFKGAACILLVHHHSSSDCVHRQGYFQRIRHNSDIFIRERIWRTISSRETKGRCGTSREY